MKISVRVGSPLLLESSFNLKTSLGYIDTYLYKGNIEIFVTTWHITAKRLDKNDWNSEPIDFHVGVDGPLDIQFSKFRIKI